MKLLTYWMTTILLALSSACGAQDMQPGRDYTLVSPPMATAKDKIEVIEFFSYGCSHCNEFNPVITKWVEKLPKDVSFKKVPVAFSDRWIPFSKLFFALQMTGEFEKLDTAAFNAIHKERVIFNSDESIIEWAVKKGVDRKKIAEAVSSFSMPVQLERAKAAAASAKITGVPSILVDGKFLAINTSTDGTWDSYLKTTDGLIAKARQERKTK